MERAKEVLKIMVVGLVVVAIVGLLTNWFTNWGSANDAFNAWAKWVNQPGASSSASSGATSSSLSSIMGSEAGL